MNVLMLSPVFPAEMQEFTRALAEAGARVYGVGDTKPQTLPEGVRKSLAGYIAVRSLWDADAVISALRSELRGRSLDRIECLWAPGIVLAARLREAFGVAGLTVSQAERFSDKAQLRQALDRAGIRAPRQVVADSPAAAWEAAGRIGFPLILKPLHGAGSADTYQVRDVEELRAVLPRLQHVPAIGVEEFIEGEEFSFDTISAGGRVLYHSIAWYRPRPLIARGSEWVSPQVIALRNVGEPNLAAGVRMGFAVIGALGFDTGFTHMKWYRTGDGEVVFGGIGAHPPDAHRVDQMKYVCEFDPFREWANAVKQGTISGGITPKYHVANVYKRARGVGRITCIEGLEGLQRDFGDRVIGNTLLPVGTPRRDWRKTLSSDGFVMLRHRELDSIVEMADRVGAELHLYAG